MIKLSKTSKLDGIKSWSLEAGATCPGSHKKGGELVDACRGCYAKGGNYRFKNVKAPRVFNREDWKRDGWADDMVAALDDSRYFRWFDSGDVYTKGLALKILEVMQRTPWVQHWLPTRSYKFPKIAAVLEQMQSLPNVMVRYSSDSVTGEYQDGLHGSVIITEGGTVASAGIHECKAYENDGKCGGCRACYSKDVPVVGYVAHGMVMKKVIRLTLAA